MNIKYTFLATAIAVAMRTSALPAQEATIRTEPELANRIDILLVCG